MKEQWHNKELQGGLGDYDSPMDLELAWEALDAKRHPKKDKRRFYWFWFVGLILVLSALGYYGLKHTEPNENNQPRAQYPLINQTEVQVQTNTNNDVPTEIKKSESIEVTTEIQKKKEVVLKQQEIVVSRSKQDDLSFLSSDISKSKKKNDNIIDNTINNTNSQNTNVQLTVSTNNNTNPSNIEGGIIEDKAVVIEEGGEDAEFLLKKDVHSILNAPLLVDELGVPTTIEAEKEKEKTTLLAPEVEDKSNVRPLHKSSFGISSTFAFLTSGSIRDDEKSLDVLAASVFYERDLFSNFYFKTGLTYQQFTNEVKVEDTYSYYQTESNELILTNYYQSGVVEQVMGEAVIEYRDNNQHTLYNRYRFVNIPITLGYKFSICKKANLKLETGLSASVFTAHSGKLYSNGLIEPFDDIDGYKSKSLGVFQGLLGLQYEREIGLGNYLFAGSQINIELNESVSIIAIDRTRFGLVGFVVGYRKRL